MAGRDSKISPTAIDLFCGAGGLTEGLKRAGIRVAAAVEKDSFAATVYECNHPDVTLLRSDIRSITGPALLRRAKLLKGELDLLAACPPCQGFSAMRTRNGSRRNRDERNNLVGEVLRLTRSMRPKAIMVENVPGLQRDRRFQSLVGGLLSLGYHVRYQVVDVADHCVPQRRKRLVLLASRTRPPVFARPIYRLRTVRDAIGRLEKPERSGDEIHNYPSRRSDKVARIIKAIPKDGGSRSALPNALRLKCHRKTDGFRDVYGRMRWDAPAPTITGGCINPSKGRYIHPSQDRPITLREAALLQGFPKGYRFPWGKGRCELALMIGNALPPEFIKRHAVALMDSVLASAP